MRDGRRICLYIVLETHIRLMMVPKAVPPREGGAFKWDV